MEDLNFKHLLPDLPYFLAVGKIKITSYGDQ